MLYLRGRGGPHWYCYETRQGGDMLAAIQYALRLDFVGALDWARDFLGLRGTRGSSAGSTAARPNRPGQQTDRRL